jgi:RsiW-degrading membrane proteinase PrsW (M82 family)
MFTILLVLIPTFFYLFIVWLMIPKTIKFKGIFYYLLFGMSSIVLIRIIHNTIPGFFLPHSSSLIFINHKIDFFLYLSIIQIGLIEEISKFFSFIIIKKFLVIKEKIHPLGVMVNYGMVGLSFGTLENLHYANQFGDGIIFSRSVTAMLLHLLLGLITGYCMALIDLKPNKLNESRLDGLFKKNRIFKITFYSICGIGISTIIHGIYNFNLFIGTESSWSIMLTQLCVTLFITYIGAKHLISRFKKDLIKLKNYF